MVFIVVWPPYIIIITIQTILFTQDNKQYSQFKCSRKKKDSHECAAGLTFRTGLVHSVLPVSQLRSSPPYVQEESQGLEPQYGKPKFRIPQPVEETWGERANICDKANH